MGLYPESPVWSHPVFRHPAYRPYAEQVSTHVQKDDRPSQLTVLTEALPVLTDYLTSIDSRNAARIAELADQLKKALEAQGAEIRQLKDQISRTGPLAVWKPLLDLADRVKMAGPDRLPDQLPDPQPDPQPDPGYGGLYTGR